MDKTANLRPWQPGQSGNPGGRPKEVVHVRDLARMHTEDAIKTLYAIMSDEKCRDTARVAAAEALLNRAWGKPEQAVQVTGFAEGPLQIVLTHASH